MSSYSKKKNRKPPQYHLKCLQINLHHSKLASLSLAHVVLDWHCYDTRTVRVLSHSSCCCQYSSWLLRTPQLVSRSCIWIGNLIRDSLAKAYKMSTKHPDNHVSCIELKTHSGVFLFASVYLRPSAHNPENSLNSFLIYCLPPHLSFAWTLMLVISRGTAPTLTLGVRILKRLFKVESSTLPIYPRLNSILFLREPLLSTTR
jgi:hypothetical protein